jgi:antirestriction protein
MEEIQEILESSPVEGAEEWAIHDYEGFGGLRLDEYEEIETLVEIADLISEQGVLVTHVVGHCGGLEYLEEARRLMEECYQGAYDNTIEWAEDFLEDTGELDKIPEHLRGYFDFERYAHDAEISGEIFTVEVGGKTHIFWSQ